MEQLCFEGEQEECKWIRVEMLSWNKKDFWFYVMGDQIWVANEMGGRVKDEILVDIKKKALDLSHIWREKNS